MTVRTSLVLDNYMPTDYTNVCWYTLSLLILCVCVCRGGRLNMLPLLCKVMSFYGLQGRHKICSLSQALEQY